MTESTNINEIIRISLKSLTDTVKNQGLAIRDLSKKLSNKPSREEIDNYLKFKPNDDEILTAINNLSQELNNRPTHEEIVNALDQKINKDELMFYLNQKNNSEELNITEEQRKKLNKFIKKINATIFEGTCYTQCIDIILGKSGQISASGQGIIPLSQCKTFLKHFDLYISSRIKKIYSNLFKLTESYEPTELFQYLSLLGFYIKLFGQNSDKNVLKSAWQVQKKIVNINIVGISSFNIEKFLNGFEEFKRGISLDPASVERSMKTSLTSLEKQFHYMISNFNKNILTWATYMDNIFSNSKDFSSKAQGNPKLFENTSKKIKLIIEGLCTANYLRRNISFILDSHLHFSIQLDEEIINEIISGLELIKVIEFEFSKLMNLISLNIS